MWVGRLPITGATLEPWQSRVMRVGVEGVGREWLVGTPNSSLATQRSAATWAKERGRSDPAGVGVVQQATVAPLFAKCRAWIKELRRSVGGACEWKHPRAPALRLLFQDEHATPAVPTFTRGERSGGW